MRRISLLVVAMVVAFPALAQNPPATTPVRIRGTVEKLDGNALTVKARDGQTAVVALADQVNVIALGKKALADLKPGDTVASTGIKKDGKIHAIEVRVLPQPFADGGRQYAWDLQPDSVMTNATLGTVTKTADGTVFHVKFQDGESDYTVGPDTVILANIPGDKGLLVPGAAVMVIGAKQPDGTINSRVLFAEKDGVKPPM